LCKKIPLLLLNLSYSHVFQCRFMGGKQFSGMCFFIFTNEQFNERNIYQILRSIGRHLTSKYVPWIHNNIRSFDDTTALSVFKRFDAIWSKHNIKKKRSIL